jgi:hypothetical protein
VKADLKEQIMNLYETYYGNNIQELSDITTDDSITTSSTDYTEVKHKTLDPLFLPTFPLVKNSVWVVLYCKGDIMPLPKKCYVVSCSFKEALEKCMESGIGDDHILSVHRVNELNETVIV